MNMKIPKDTTECVENTTIENFSLRLNRFIKYGGDGKPLIYRKEKKRNGVVEEKAFMIDTTFQHTEKILDNQRTAIREIANRYKYKETIKAITSWRVAVGGEASVYETSIKLHHIYGVPYIPGQAIKGVVRSYIITEYFECDEKKALKSDDFVKIFGSTENKGGVSFFDSFPVNPAIEIDVISNHNKEYYQKKNIYPNDSSNPKIIFFLTVGKRTKFEITFAGNEDFENASFQTEEMEKINLVQAVKNTLLWNGIGKKTSAGYGYMDIT